MAGPPANVWVEVATELLAELGDWSEPVQVRIHDLRPNGQVQMELRTSETPWVAADLALALRLLDHVAHELRFFHAEMDQPILPELAEAHALLVRHGIREA